MTPITPMITMSWGLSFLCIPCATACADMIVIVIPWARVDHAPYAIIKRCLAGCLAATNKQTQRRVKAQEHRHDVTMPAKPLKVPQIVEQAYSRKAE